MRRVVFRLAVLIAIGFAAGTAQPCCNLIPSATQEFRGTLGVANKPFAAPGDYVEVGVPGTCGATVPLEVNAGDHIVTLVFTPPSSGTRRVAFLTADSCTSTASMDKLHACEQIVGEGLVGCVPGAESNLQIVTRDSPHLSFRFPDTDALFAPAGDTRTLSGPVTIAVTAATQPLPCDLAAKPCAAETGVLACIDDLFAADGTCAPNAHPTFPHFTALPVPNDYQAACFGDDPPCTALAAETRVAVDTAGNLLLPVNWQGILVSHANVPVPRLLRATLKSPLPLATPPAVALAAFTPEGARLPPIFEPQADPSVTEPGVITLFGSADAAYSILRIARAVGTCIVGPNAGEACIDSRDCGGTCVGGTVPPQTACTADADCGPGGQCALCVPTCVSGTVPSGTACTKDGDCGHGGRCAALFADFRPLVKSGGPLVLPRALPGICQLAPHQGCSPTMPCPGPGNPCVSYALEARTPVRSEEHTSELQSLR